MQASWQHCRRYFRHPLDMVRCVRNHEQYRSVRRLTVTIDFGRQDTQRVSGMDEPGGRLRRTG